MFGFNPSPKPSHSRRTPKQKDRSNFSSKTIKEITERDNGQCVRCGSPHIESVPHHVIFRSQGGTGHKRNGVTICIDCHRRVHQGKETEYYRMWFVNWVEDNLDQDGNLVNS